MDGGVHRAPEAPAHTARGADKENEIRLAFPARSDNVAFARTAVAVFASRLDFTLDELDEIKVAVSEAVSNCVLHAYPEGPGWVHITMRVDDGALHVTVSDDGVGMADPERCRQAGVTTRPDDCMGLGFTFMAEYMDSLTVQSAPGEGTRVTMSKRPRGSVPEETSGPWETEPGDGRS
ncbi:MAG: anti-sigma F factor [Limnochordales bacterium]